MAPNFWIGIVVIVCVLEAIRIGLSAFVLVHILERLDGPDQGEPTGRARRSLETAGDRARREALLPHTLTALRGAMDEVSTGRSDAQVEQAIEALDRYADQLRKEEHRS